MENLICKLKGHNYGLYEKKSGFEMSVVSGLLGNGHWELEARCIRCGRVNEKVKSSMTIGDATKD